MTAHWTFNGTVQNLHIFIYAPPGQIPTCSTPAPSDSEIPQPAGRETPCKATAPDIKEEEAQYREHERSFYDEQSSSNAPRDEFALPDEQNVNHNRADARDDASDYLNVFMRPLPWGESANTQPSEQFSLPLKTDDEDGVCDTTLGNILAVHSRPQSSAPAPDNFREFLLTETGDGQNPLLKTVLPSFRQLSIAYDDLDSDSSSDISGSMTPSSNSDTPCPRRAPKFAIRPTKKTARSSPYFSRAAKDGTLYAPHEKRFIRGPITRRSQVTQSESASNLTENLRRIECTPSHKWAHEERELLCVLRRWYNTIGGWDNMTKIFNHLTGNTLNKSVVMHQWHDLLYFGQDPALSSVYYFTPFADPRGHFQEARKDIEICANTLGIEIQPRGEEEHVKIGNAIASKSPLVQRKLRLLASRTAVEVIPKQLSGDSFPKPFSRMKTPVLSTPISPDNSISFQDDVDEIENIKLNDLAGVSDDFNEEPIPKFPVKNQTIPTLVYRCYDEESQSSLDPRLGFRASLYNSRRRGVTNPLSMDDELFEVFAENHFWHHKKGCSPFISTTSSLLFALLVATRSLRSGLHPSVAVIDTSGLGARSWLASNIISTLKRKGEFAGMRYQGNYEFLVWGDIPSSAVIHSFNFSDLEILASNNPSVQQILRLDKFKPQVRGHTLHSRFVEEALQLDRQIAAGIGSLANMFGLRYASEEQIADFVGNLVNSFALNAPTNGGVMDSLGTAFAESLNDYSTRRRCISEAFDEISLRNTFRTAVVQGAALTERRRGSNRKHRSSKKE